MVVGKFYNKSKRLKHAIINLFEAITKKRTIKEILRKKNNVYRVEQINFPVSHVIKIFYAFFWDRGITLFRHWRLETEKNKIRANHILKSIGKYIRVINTITHLIFHWQNDTEWIWSFCELLFHTSSGTISAGINNNVLYMHYMCIVIGFGN